MIRLDKYLCEMQAGTRSEVKNMIRKGCAAVNGKTEKNADRKIDEQTDEVTLNGKKVSYQKYVYLLLNKPAGVVSATRDNHDETVLDWVRKKDPENPLLKRELPPVGRLDKDTEGLLLLTDDGALSHRLLAPTKHVEKTYYVELDGTLDAEQIAALEQGVDIGEDVLTKSAKVELIEHPNVAVTASGDNHSTEAKYACHLTITEGKFHQVKRMMQAVGRTVVYLKRVRMGGLWLDPRLEIGEFRELTEEELLLLEK